MGKVKFIYSEKATKFCEIFTLLLTKVHTVKSKEKISQSFVAFSEFMNFTNIFQKSVKIGNGNANLVNAYQKLSVVTEFQTVRMQLMNWIAPHCLLFLTATI